MSKLISGIFLLAIALSAGCRPSYAAPPRWISFETGANVKTMALDGKLLWLGLANGIIRFDTRDIEQGPAPRHEVFTAQNTAGGLLSNGVYKIIPDGRGGVWIGTYGGGLSHRNSSGGWRVSTPYGSGIPARYGSDWSIAAAGTALADLWVYDIYQDEKGRLWLATWKGLSVLEEDRFRTFTTDDGLADDWVYAIARDSNGTFWLGTEGGLNRFDGKHWSTFTHRDGLGADVPGAGRSAESPGGDPGAGYGHHGGEKRNIGANPNFILDLAIDRQGAVWIGTWGAGLSRFLPKNRSGRQWTNFTSAQGLGGNFVHAVEIDRDGVVWAATNGGVSRLTGSGWTTYTTADGLLDNNVFSIVFDERGGRWFGTWRGVSYMTGE